MPDVVLSSWPGAGGAAGTAGVATTTPAPPACLALFYSLPSPARGAAPHNSTQVKHAGRRGGEAGSVLEPWLHGGHTPRRRRGAAGWRAADRLLCLPPSRHPSRPHPIRDIILTASLEWRCTVICDEEVQFEGYGRS